MSRGKEGFIVGKRKSKPTPVGPVIQVKTLFGGLDRVPPDADLHALAISLITELVDKADDEHYQVAAIHDDCSVTIGSSGMASLDDMNARLPSVYTRLQSRADGVSLLEALLRGDLDAVRARSWVPRAELPPKPKQAFGRK